VVPSERSNITLPWSIHSYPILRYYNRKNTKEGNPESRNLADSAALAAKVAKKAEMKKKQEEEEQRNAANKPVVVKSKAKKKKEPAGLDDLLSAGLAKGKKK